MKNALKLCCALVLVIGVITMGILQARRNAQEPSPEIAHYFQEDLTIFERKKAAGPSDWLAVHKEPGQTYQEYLRSKPNFPDKKRNVLYLQPMGEFGPDAPSLTDLHTYMKAYYMPLEVKMLKPIPSANVKATSRLNAGRLQWKTSDILSTLHQNLPKDSYGLLAVTMTDLYPSEKWNFVFGQASLRNRVGVFSFARYGAKDQKLAFTRAAKVLTHEMGHMFGIKHCTQYQCNLNGANHLAEMDQAPLHLCPVCLQKLHKANGFDPEKRYQALHAFYKTHRMEEPEKWVQKRLEK